MLLFESRSGEVYSIQHYVIKLSVTCAGGWFSPGTPVSSTNKTDRHDITEILLKVALNIITITPLENAWTLCRDENLAFCNGHNAPTRYRIGEFSMGAVIYQSLLWHYFISIYYMIGSVMGISVHSPFPVLCLGEVDGVTSCCLILYCVISSHFFCSSSILRLWLKFCTFTKLYTFYWHNRKRFINLA